MARRSRDGLEWAFSTTHDATAHAGIHAKYPPKESRTRGRFHDIPRARLLDGGVSFFGTLATKLDDRKHT